MVQAIKEFRGLILLLFLCIGVSSLNAGNKTKTSISTDIAALDSLKPIDNFTFELDEVESEYVANQIIRDSYDVAYRIVEGKVDAPSGARLVYRAFNLSAAYTDAKWPEKIRNKCIVIVTQDGVPTHAFLTSPGSGGMAKAGVYKIHKAIRGWAAPGMYQSLFFHGWKGRENVYAIHGTPPENNRYLGQPASHGCQRVKMSNSETAFSIYEKYNEGYVTIRNSYDDLTAWEKSWLYSDEIVDWVEENLK